MVTCSGSHGTSYSRADNIVRTQFEASKGRTRLGDGVYFYHWSGSNHDYARELAWGWFEHQKAMGAYSNDAVPSAAIIYSHFEAQEHEILNLDDEPYYGELMKFAKELEGKLTAEEFCKICKKVIERVIATTGVVIKIICARLWPPAEAKVPKEIGKVPIYLVREVDCIKIAYAEMYIEHGNKWITFWPRS